MFKIGAMVRTLHDSPDMPKGSIGEVGQLYSIDIEVRFNDEIRLFPLDTADIWLELVEPAKTDDPVNHPKHYTSHPSGIECIQVTEHMSFNIGNAIKYLWRADEKGAPIQDLEKAKWYIEREIAKRRR